MLICLRGALQAGGKLAQRGIDYCHRLTQTRCVQLVGPVGGGGSRTKGSRDRADKCFPGIPRNFRGPYQRSIVRRRAINCTPTWRWSTGPTGVGSSQPSVGLPDSQTDGRTDSQTDRRSVKQATSQSVRQSVCQLLNAAFIMRRFALFSAEKIIRAARSVELDQTISWEYGK